MENYVEKKYCHHLEKLVYNAFRYVYKDDKDSDFLTKLVRFGSKSVDFIDPQDYGTISQTSTS
jgi:hypothetical protein